MTHVEKIENLTKYLMESEGYTETQAKLEAIRVLIRLELNKVKYRTAPPFCAWLTSDTSEVCERYVNRDSYWL